MIVVRPRIHKAPGKDQRKKYKKPSQRAKSRRDGIDDECNTKHNRTARIPVSEPIDLSMLQGVAEQQKGGDECPAATAIERLSAAARLSHLRRAAKSPAPSRGKATGNAGSGLGHDYPRMVRRSAGETHPLFS